MLRLKPHYLERLDWWSLYHHLPQSTSPHDFTFNPVLHSNTVSYHCYESYSLNNILPPLSIPDEIIFAIVHLLNLKEFYKARLISRAWTLETLPLMARSVFIGLPWRNGVNGSTTLVEYHNALFISTTSSSTLAASRKCLKS